jgi:uncharacterized delta-60 repeat protein
MKSFGLNGTVVTDIGSIYDCANAVAIQSDGKIVVAGVGYWAAGDFALVRYNSDGTPDKFFGTNGIVITDIGTGSDDGAYAVAIQQDGRVVVAGISDANGGLDFALVRYTKDGTPDKSFGPKQNGIVITDIGQNSADKAYSVAIQQQDGTIVVAGNSDANGGLDFALVRYDSSGNLDKNFGTNGIVITDVGATGRYSLDYAYWVGILSDGKIVAAGYSTDWSQDFALVYYDKYGTQINKVTTDIGTMRGGTMSVDCAFGAAIDSTDHITLVGFSVTPGSSRDFALVRYDSSGNLDKNFGTNGIVITDIRGDILSGETGVVSSQDEAYAVAIQPPDGKAVVVGRTSIDQGVTYDFALARYNPNGTLDTPDHLASEDKGAALLIQPDGKIVAVGTYSAGGKQSFALIRYTENVHSGRTGIVDTSFGTNGKVITDIGTNSIDSANAAVMQSGGKIVVAGSTCVSGICDFALVRYNSDGTLDRTFGTKGKVITDIQGNSDEAFAVAIQSIQSVDRIVAAGRTCSQNQGCGLALVRYDSNGTLDTSFGTNGTGMVTTWSARHQGSAVANAVAIQPVDGKIVVAGSINSDFAVIRYTPDGTPDISFGSTGNGIATLNIDGVYYGNGAIDSTDIANAVAIQPVDGKIVVAGSYSRDSSEAKIALVRYDSSGYLDNQFGDSNSGVVTRSYGDHSSANALVIQPATGKILVAGYVRWGTDSDFLLWCFNSDGTDDTSFGNSGSVVTYLGTDSPAGGMIKSEAHSVGLLLEGADIKIVAGGSSWGGTSGNDFALAKYYLVDNPPRILSISRGNPTNSYTKKSMVTFTVTFDQPVWGLGLRNLRVSASSGIQGASTQFHYIQPIPILPGYSWSVKVDTGTGIGTLGLNLVDATGIIDATGNALATQLPFAGETYNLYTRTRIP